MWTSSVLDVSYTLYPSRMAFNTRAMVGLFNKAHYCRCCCCLCRRCRSFTHIHIDIDEHMHARTQTHIFRSLNVCRYECAYVNTYISVCIVDVLYFHLYCTSAANVKKKAAPAKSKSEWFITISLSSIHKFCFVDTVSIQHRPQNVSVFSESHPKNQRIESILTNHLPFEWNQPKTKKKDI